MLCDSYSTGYKRCKVSKAWFCQYFYVFGCVSYGIYYYVSNNHSTPSHPPEGDHRLSPHPSDTLPQNSNDGFRDRIPTSLA